MKLLTILLAPLLVSCVNTSVIILKDMPTLLCDPKLQEAYQLNTNKHGINILERNYLLDHRCKRKK